MTKITPDQQNRMFQPVLNDAQAALPLLLAIVQGNVEALQQHVAANPEDFFKKGQVTDLSGKTFYNVTPFQLIVFLCDMDMLCQILPFIPIELLDQCASQYAEINSGGADLVKMDRDPTTLDFSEIIQFTTPYDIDGVATPVSFPLLESPIGIICFVNPETQEHRLYLVNQETKTVEPLEFKWNSEVASLLEKLNKFFTNMENNSSRRSSNEEHAHIEHLTGMKLPRKGIQYEHQGVVYCDSRIDFNKLINAYRKCIRLNQEGLLDKADECWRKEVGGAQRQVLWILQRLCEPNRPFYPIPESFTSPPFQRSFAITNYPNDTFLCCRGVLTSDLGTNFGVYKDVQPGARCKKYSNSFISRPADLVAVNWLIENAKKRVIEFQSIKVDDTSSTYNKPFRYDTFKGVL